LDVGEDHPCVIVATISDKETRAMKMLIVGAGSIGRRHMRNLRALGIQHLAACDPDPDRLAPMVTELGIQPFADFDKAMTATKPDSVFVCTPPVFHVSQALQAVQAGAHVFVEKPLSHALDGIDELIAEAEARQRVVQVGYNLRFHPGLQKVKQLVDSGTIGRILWARVEIGQYLPDWRPWQDYRQSYTARRDLGGGIILDASHELDYIIWLLGQPIEVMCMAGKVSDLEVDVEDCATVLLRFAGGVQVDVHMDFVQRGYARSCRLTGEQGTIVWDYPAHEVRVYHAEVASWETMAYDFDSNDMYVAELKHFLQCIDQAKTPLVDLRQAKTVLRVAVAAKSSAARGCLEVLS
jgi:predicted dehydrogenase